MTVVGRLKAVVFSLGLPVATMTEGAGVEGATTPDQPRQYGTGGMSPSGPKSGLHIFNPRTSWQGHNDPSAFVTASPMPILGGIGDHS